MFGLTCEWRVCIILDPCDCLFLLVCKFLCRGAIRGKADSKGVFPQRTCSPWYGSGRRGPTRGHVDGCCWSDFGTTQKEGRACGKSITNGPGSKNICEVLKHCDSHISSCSSSLYFICTSVKIKCTSSDEQNYNCPFQQLQHIDST